MAYCIRKAKTLISTCVILSGVSNLLCLVYIGWVSNYLGSGYIRVKPPEELKLEEDRRESQRLRERLDRLEDVVSQHLQELPQKQVENVAGDGVTESSLFAHWGRDLTPENRRTALKMFQYYGYNSYLSDQLPLDRPIPDFQPDGCKNISYAANLPQVSVVFIFVNEAPSVVLRSIHSVISKTPAHLLKEIVLVDDNSNNDELKEKLRAYVDKTNARQPGFVKVIRHSKQEGLIRSRVSGWRAATAPVVALFDAHVEFNVRCPTAAQEGDVPASESEGEEFEPHSRRSWGSGVRGPQGSGVRSFGSEFWVDVQRDSRGYCEQEQYLILPEVFGHKGVYARFVSPQVWQCGGSVEVLPCSRLAHIERAHKPYTEDLTAHVRRNALRVAEVWMDEFKSHVYMAWNIPSENSGIDIGDILDRKALRRKLQCKSFKWYLHNVYPEMRMYTDTVAYGMLKNFLKSDLCLDQGPDTDNIPIMYICHGMTSQNVYYMSNQQIRVGLLSPTIDDDDNKCLVDVNSRPRLIECSYAKAKRMKLYWLFTQGGSIQNRKSKRCLELQESTDNEFGFQLVLQKCSGQQWTISNVVKKPSP
ncbi:polypeptide N-acetylgalactosaminyltransferase 18-like [Heptranchias perlo]|uniref:polypeptide N-acetylgalactosaminyltransferase 18-like n=1 Tax=Heptranchias perlo TaxID=212740 RepID=UPI00355A1326